MRPNRRSNRRDVKISKHTRHSIYGKEFSVRRHNRSIEDKRRLREDSMRRRNDLLLKEHKNKTIFEKRNYQPSSILPKHTSIMSWCYRGRRPISCAAMESCGQASRLG